MKFAKALTVPAVVCWLAPSAGLSVASPASTTASKIVERARLEVTRGVRYDAQYRKIGYPGGDVPEGLGACTDVVIRALRAVGRDLQQLIRDDKRRHPDQYPRSRGTLDPHIDHRRVPNQLAFLRRFGTKLPIGLTGADLKSWKPGDLVYVKLPSGLDHCGVISDRVNENGVPLMIHNLGQAAEEDVLGSWKIVAHYRYPR